MGGADIKAMPAADSTVLDRRKLALARNLLVTPVRPERVWPVLAAAAFAAATALAFAAATIMAPPVVSEHVVRSQR